VELTTSHPASVSRLARSAAAWRWRRVAGDAEGVEVGDGQEAEQRSGPLGDGPVEVAGHGAAA
jgi:hypothetical protein